MNLFTLLSLWMELFPQEQMEEDNTGQVNAVGLVVVKDSKVVGLHSSGAELHAGQAAILQHGSGLTDCHLYFSRRPCATCLKMIINVGVTQICFWPGDPEVPMLRSSSSSAHLQNSHGSSDVSISEEASLDAMATDRLKSNSRAHICVPLQPLTSGIAQFVHETSRDCDFMERVMDDQPQVDGEQIYNRERLRHLKSFSCRFLVGTSQQHQRILTHMGLENFCVEPYFSSLRHNMTELVQVLAAVVAGLPLQQDYGFHREPSSAEEPSPMQREGVSQEVARHCMAQARLLAYRTEDHKVGVGAVIWAKGDTAGCRQTGGLYLIGCGYNAYPTGSQYLEYPQMDGKQEDRQRRKYRYIVHAEQNALTFRTCEIKQNKTVMLFVTKCPCDECVPLIRGAGVTHIYTTDQDRDKDKGDISYLRFSRLKGVCKFIWQRSPSRCLLSSSHFANGFVGKHSRELEPERRSCKKHCSDRTQDSLSVV